MIVIVSGPINAGKSTVARQLSRLVPDSLYIDGDNRVVRIDSDGVGLRSFTVIGNLGKVRINSTQPVLLSLSKSKPMDPPVGQ